MGGERLKDQGVKSVSCGNWTHLVVFLRSYDCVRSCGDPCNHRKIVKTRSKDQHIC